MDYTVADKTDTTGWLESTPLTVTKGAAHVNVNDAKSFTGTVTDNPNYTFTVNPGTLTINPAAATASFKVTGKTYDGQTVSSTDYAVTLTADNSNLKLAAVPPLSLTDVTGLENAKDAKTYQLKLTADAIQSIKNLNPNFTITGLDGATDYTISPRPVTVTVKGATFTYDGANHALTATVATENTSNNSGLVTGDTLNYTLSPASETNVGTYSVSVVSGTNPNYDINGQSADLTINQQTQAVTMDATTGKTYDGQAIDYVPSVTINGTSYKLANTTGDQQYNIVDNSANAGTYTIELTTQGATDLKAKFTNYNLGDLSSIKTTYTIAKKKVTLQVVSQSVTYDGQAHKLSARVATDTPLVGTDTLTYTLSDATAGHTDVSATPYPVTVTANATDNPNYDITPVSGALTITAAKATATLTATDMAYDGSNITPTMTLNADNTALQNKLVIPTDLKAEGMDQSGDFTNTNTTSGHNQFGDVGAYQIKLSASGIERLKAANPNFDFGDLTTVTTTANITPAAVKMSIADDSKVYDGKTITLKPKFAIAPQVAGQDVGQLSIDASALPGNITSADFDYNQTATDAGTYQVSVKADSLAKLTTSMYNYSISGGITAGDYKITQRPVYVSLADKTVVYDGTAQKLTPTTKAATDQAGLVAGQTLNFDETGETNVGSYPMTVTFPVNDATDKNYQILNAAGNKVTSLTANLTITAGATTATLALDKASKAFDGKTIADSGLIPTMTVNGTPVVLTSQDLAVESDSANKGTYTVKLGESGLTKLKADYPNLDATKFSDASTTIEITAKPITITVTGGKFTYDGQVHTATIDDSGAVAGTPVKYTVDDGFTNVGKKAITLTALATDNPDYTITVDQANNEVEITAKAATVALSMGTGSKQYDGQPLPDLTATLTSTNTGDNTIQPTAVTGFAKDTDYTIDTKATNNGVGTYTITLTTAGENKIKNQTGNSNFNFDSNFAKAPTMTYKITAIPVAASAITMPAENKTYDGQAVSYDPSRMTLVASDLQPSLGTLTAADFDVTNSDTTVTDGDASDSYTVKMKAATWAKIIADNPNFDFSKVDAPQTTYTVNKRDVTLKVNSNTATPATYDGNAKSVTAEATDATSVVSGQTLDIKLSYADSKGKPVTGDIVNAGTYTVTASAGTGTVNRNYTIQSGTGQLVINRETVNNATLALNKSSKTYDGKAINTSDFTGDFAGTLTYAGQTVNLPFSDFTITGNSKDVKFVTDDKGNKVVAGYTVTLDKTALDALATTANYDLQGLANLSQTFTINPKPVTLTITDGSATYDGLSHVSTAAASGVLNGETLALTTAASETNVGTYDAPTYQKNNAVNANYAVTVTGPTTFTISKKAATIALSTGTKTYDGQKVNFAPTVTLSAASTTGNTVQPSGTVILTADDVTVVDNAAAANTYTVKLNQSGLDKIQAAGNDQNFDFGTLDKVATTTYTIDPQAATISFDTVNKVYDGSSTIDFTPTIKLTSTAGADAVQPTAVTLTADDITVANNAKDVNTYHFTLNVSGKAKVQADKNFSYANLDVTGDYNITKRPVTITVNPGTVDYNGTAQSPTVTVQPADNTAHTGVVAGETLGYTTPSETKAGDYQTSVTVKSDTEDPINKNYTITPVAGLFSIVASATTYAFAAGTRRFDGKSVEDGWQPKLSLAGTKVDLEKADYTVTPDKGITDGDVGHYTVALTDAGKLKALNAFGQYSLTTLADAQAHLKDTSFASLFDQVDKSATTYDISARPVTVNVDHDSVTYDGTAHQVSWTAAAATEDTGLVSGFDLTIDKVTSATNVGDSTTTATVSFKPSNYDVTVNGGSLTITAQGATVTAVKGTKVYDGQNVDWVPTLTLLSTNKAADAVQPVLPTGKDALTSADFTVASNAAAANTYQVSLAASGLAKLNAANNNNFDFGALATTYEIKKRPVTLTLKGGGTFTYDGTTTHTPSVTVEAFDSANNSGIVTGDSLHAEVINDATQQVATDLMAAGSETYHAKYDTNANYTVTMDPTTNSQTIKVDQADATPTIVAAEKTQDGQMVNADLQVTATSTITPQPKAVTLTSAMYTVANNSALPGVYTVKINQAGITALENANPNYSFSNVADLTGTYTINAKTTTTLPGGDVVTVVTTPTDGKVTEITVTNPKDPTKATTITVDPKTGAETITGGTGTPTTIPTGQSTTGTPKVTNNSQTTGTTIAGQPIVTVTPTGKVTVGDPSSKTGTTTVSTNGEGQIIAIDRTWADGIRTHVDVDSAKRQATASDLLLTGEKTAVTTIDFGKAATLTDGLLASGSYQGKTASTEITIDATGVTTFKHLDSDATTGDSTGQTTTVDPTKPTTPTETTSTTTKDPTDPKNPAAGTTVTKGVDGQVIAIDRVWSDQVKTHVTVAGDKQATITDTLPDGTVTTAQTAAVGQTLTVADGLIAGKTTTTTLTNGTTIGLNHQGQATPTKTTGTTTTVDPSGKPTDTTTTTTKNPTGGETIVTKNPAGQMIAIDRTWADGIQTHVSIDPANNDQATTYDVLLDQTRTTSQTLAAKATVTTDDGLVNALQTHTMVTSLGTSMQFNHYTDDATDPTTGPKTGTGLTVDPNGQPTDTKITTTTSPTGGTTTITKGVDGELQAIDRTWNDGVQTHVVIDATTKTATGTDSLAGKALNTITVVAGQTGELTDGPVSKTQSATTTLTNPADLTATAQLGLDHRDTDLADGNGTGQTTHVNPSGQTTDQQTTTTKDPTGGQTVITANPTGQVQSIDRTWADGIVSHLDLQAGVATLTDRLGEQTFGPQTIAADHSVTVKDLTFTSGTYAGQTAQTMVTNTGDLATLTISHQDLDANNGNGTGQKTTVDPQKPETGTKPTTPTSTTTTTTTDPAGGSTTITTGPQGTVTAIDRLWSDGVRTHADVTDNSATVYDVVAGQLTAKVTLAANTKQTIQDGKLTTGQTAYTVVNSDAAGKLAFDHQDLAAAPKTGATGQTTTVDVKDPAQKPVNATTTTTSDPKGGQTTVTTDPQHKVTSVQRTWSDGVVTNVTVDAEGNLHASDTIGDRQTGEVAIADNANATLADGLLTTGPNSQQIASTKITNLSAGKNIQFDHRDVKTDDQQQPTGNGTGQTTTVDPTVVDGTTATTKTTNPSGGTTVVTTNTEGQVITIDRTWSDGITTHVVVAPKTGQATVTDQLDGATKATATVESGQTDTLADGDLATGETATTQVVNAAPTGQVTLSHFDTKVPTTTGSTTAVDPKGTLTDTTTSTVEDPAGGKTTVTKNAQGQMIKLDRTWSDGVQTHAIVDPTTHTAQVTDELVDGSKLSTITIELGGASQTIQDGTLSQAAEAQFVGQVAMTEVTNTAADGLQLNHTDHVVDAQGKPTNNGSGQTITADPTGSTTTGETTTTVDPKGGQTTVTTDPTGQLTMIDRTWADGIKTQVTVQKDGSLSATDTLNNGKTVTVTAIAVAATSVIQDGTISGGQFDQQTATTTIVNGGTVKTISFDHQDVPTSGHPTGQITTVDPSKPTQPTNHQTTTFIDPNGGQTIVTTNASGEVTTIDRTWSDGIKTHVVIDRETGNADVEDTLTTGEQKQAKVLAGSTGQLADSADVSTQIDNQQLTGNVKLKHGTTTQITTSTITPTGNDTDTIETTTVDPKGGQTAVTKDPSGQVLTIDRTWKDGVKTHVAIDPTTGIATVTDTLDGNALAPATVANDGQPVVVADGTITATGDYTGQTAKTTVTNQLPTGQVSLNHEDTNPTTKATTGQITTTDPQGNPTNTQSTTSLDPNGGSVKVTFDAQNRLVAIDRIWFDGVHTHVDVDPLTHLATATDAFWAGKATTGVINIGYQGTQVIDDGAVSATHTATTQLINNSTADTQGSIALHHQQALIQGTGGQGQTTIVSPKGQPSDTATTILPTGNMVEVVKDPSGQVTKITSTDPTGNVTVIDRNPQTGKETVTDPNGQTQVIDNNGGQTEKLDVKPGQPIKPVSTVKNDTESGGHGTSIGQPDKDATDPNFTHQIVVDNNGVVTQFKYRLGSGVSVNANDFYTGTTSTGPNGMIVNDAKNIDGQIVKITVKDPGQDILTVVNRDPQTGQETITTTQTDPTTGAETTTGPTIVKADSHTTDPLDGTHPLVMNDTNVKANGDGTQITITNEKQTTPVTATINNDGQISYSRLLGGATSVKPTDFYDNTIAKKTDVTGTGLQVGVNSLGQVTTIDKTWPDGTKTHVVVDHHDNSVTVTDTLKDGKTVSSTVPSGTKGTVDDDNKIGTKVNNLLPTGNVELSHGPITTDVGTSQQVVTDPTGKTNETITTKLSGGPDLQVTTNTEPQTTQVVVSDPGQKPITINRDPQTGKTVVTGGTTGETTVTTNPVSVNGQTTVSTDPKGNITIKTTDPTKPTTIVVDHSGKATLTRTLIDANPVSVKPDDYYDNTIAKTNSTGTTVKTGVNGIGQVVTIDKTWPDGTQTHVVIDQQTKAATVTDTLKDGKTVSTTVPSGQKGTVDDQNGIGTKVNNQLPTGNVELSHGPIVDDGSVSHQTTVDPKGGVKETTTTTTELPGGTTIKVTTDTEPQTTQVIVNTPGQKPITINRDPQTGKTVVTGETTTGTPTQTTLTPNDPLAVNGRTTVTTDPSGDVIVKTTDATKVVTTTVDQQGHVHVVLSRTLIDADPVSVKPDRYYDNTTTTKTTNQTGTQIGVNSIGQVVTIDKTWPDGTQTHVVVDHQTGIVKVTDTLKNGKDVSTTVPSGQHGTVDDGNNIGTKVDNHLPNGGVDLTHGPITAGPGSTTQTTVDPKGNVTETTTTTKTAKVPNGPSLLITTNAEPQTTQIVIADPQTTITRDPVTGQVTVTGTDSTGKTTTTVLGPNETKQLDPHTTVTNNPDGSISITTTTTTAQTTATIDPQGHVVLRRVLIDAKELSVSPSRFYDNTVAKTTTSTTGTTVGTNSLGQVVTIDQQWPDGTKTHVDINHSTGTAKVQDQLSNGVVNTATVASGQHGQVVDGAGVGTKIDNQAPTGNVTLTHGSLQTKQGNVTVKVAPSGKVVLRKTLIDARGVSVDAAHYYDHTVQTAMATKDVDGGTTAVNLNQQKQPIQVKKTWSDGSATEVTLSQPDQLTVRAIDSTGFVTSKRTLTRGQTQSMTDALNDNTLITWRQNGSLLFSRTNQHGEGALTKVDRNGQVETTLLTGKPSATGKSTSVATAKSLTQPKTGEPVESKGTTEKQLPQTQENLAGGVIALGMSMLTAMLGFLGFRRKRDDKE